MGCPGWVVGMHNFLGRRTTVIRGHPGLTCSPGMEIPCGPWKWLPGVSRSNCSITNPVVRIPDMESSGDWETGQGQGAGRPSTLCEQ